MKTLCVIGSINMDLVAAVDRFPQPGETLTGLHFATFPGGKGANQAVAAARLGANVRMIGKVGKDAFGTQYLSLFDQEGVNREAVSVSTGAPTGVAVIEVNAQGENHIVVVPGANGEVDAAYLDSIRAGLEDSDLFLLQLEIPLGAIQALLPRLRQLGKTVILDPAPARPLDRSLLRNVDFLTPNETELALLSGMETDRPDRIRAAALCVLENGPRNLIAKAGRNGAYLVNRDTFLHVPGFPVNAIDTTAAGDTFNGALAAALARNTGLEEAIRFANAAAALSTTVRGAQAGMPGPDQIRRLMKHG
jgi:ribokinase